MQVPNVEPIVDAQEKRERIHCAIGMEKLRIPSWIMWVMPVSRCANASETTIDSRTVT